MLSEFVPPIVRRCRFVGGPRHNQLIPIALQRHLPYVAQAVSFADGSIYVRRDMRTIRGTAYSEFVESTGLEPRERLESTIPTH